MAGRQSVNGNSSGANDAAGAGSDAGDEVQRWTAGRKAAIVLDIIKGKTTPADAARLHGLTVADEAPPSGLRLSSDLPAESFFPKCAT